jgi:hypothetical protein
MRDVCGTYSVAVFEWTSTHLPPSPIYSVASESLVLGKYCVWSGKSWLSRVSVIYGVTIGREAYKEPKSIEGIAKISSVSTPYEPSNALPGSEAFAGVNFLAYNLGQPRQ